MAELRRSPLAVFLAGGLFIASSAARSADNLVYVPLPPCRVIDTRIAGAGGALVPGTPRSFFLRGPTRNYQASPNQGGSTTGCGIPDLGVEGATEQNVAQAVAINIVAVGPAGAGDLRAWPTNQAAPNASVINYAAVSGLNIANGVIIPMCSEVSPTPCASGDITFRADVAGAQLVVDVVGYFHAGSPALLSNTALGRGALAADTVGDGNTATGYYVLMNNTSGYLNTASGFRALQANVDGKQNTAIGANALRSNTGGSRNTATGLAALVGNTTGYANTATGFAALLDNTTGYRNTATGFYALRGNTNGLDNTAMGYSALLVNGSGIGNSAFGHYALGASTASYNTAVGDNALASDTLAGGNTAVGANALRANTTGVGNTAVGFEALTNTTGYGNAALGDASLKANTSGHQNTAVGSGAMSANTTGYANVAVGTAAWAKATGRGNTAIGASALASTTSGNRNVAVGYEAGVNLTTGSLNIDLGVGAVATAVESGVTRIGGLGYQSKAFIAGIRDVTTDLNNAIPVVIDTAGQLGTVSSSIRVKEDVHDLGATSDRLLELRPVSFRYKKPFANGEKPLQYGLIAEEVERVFPELVAYGRDGKPESVKYQDLPTLLLNELEKEHRALGALRREKDTEIAALRREKDEDLARLLARVEALERQSQLGQSKTKSGEPEHR